MTRPAAAAVIRPPMPSPPARLRRLALQVEGLSGFARRDPERQLTEQEAIVAALRAIATELEHSR